MVRWGREKSMKVMMMQVESDRSRPVNNWRKERDRSSLEVTRINSVTRLPGEQTYKLLHICAGVDMDWHHFHLPDRL